MTLKGLIYGFNLIKGAVQHSGNILEESPLLSFLVIFSMLSNIQYHHHHHPSHHPSVKPRLLLGIPVNPEKTGVQFTSFTCPLYTIFAVACSETISTHVLLHDVKPAFLSSSLVKIFMYKKNKQVILL